MEFFCGIMFWDRYFELFIGQGKYAHDFKRDFDIVDCDGKAGFSG
jgi:hypothetical protein